MFDHTDMIKQISEHIDTNGKKIFIDCEIESNNATQIFRLYELILRRDRNRRTKLNKWKVKQVINTNIFFEYFEQ